MIDSLIRFAILASEHAVGGPSHTPTAAENFRDIITKPDNIPIILMVLTLTVFTYMALRDGMKHDRLIAQGRKDEILKSMQE